MVVVVEIGTAYMSMRITAPTHEPRCKVSCQSNRHVLIPPAKRAKRARLPAFPAPAAHAAAAEVQRLQPTPIPPPP
eukprot:31146-Chlamydomonas_euryale.AAC.8